MIQLKVVVGPAEITEACFASAHETTPLHRPELNETHQLRFVHGTDLRLFHGR